MTSYELIMGLETHVRVASKTKMFCSCENAIELADNPNTSVCPICMGFPGMLPILSEGVLDKAVRAGRALKCSIQETSLFDRKSYFYPDLPQGFQITQLYHPIALDGSVETFVLNELKSFRIERMHIETDAGKLIHVSGKTLCDYNRAGSPLMEIVTKPDFRTKYEVIAYLEELQKIMRFCGASQADMEKGQLRCDVNISIRPVGETQLYNRVELKNINSFSAISRAIDHEYKRQVALVESGKVVQQETRGWDDDAGMSHSQRSKEDAMDYRYFPEPDLPPLIISQDYISQREPRSLSIERRKVYLSEYGLSNDDARILSDTPEISHFFDDLVQYTNDPKKSASCITTVLFALLQEHNLSLSGEVISVQEIANTLQMVRDGNLSSTNSKIVIEELLLRGGTCSQIVADKSLLQTNDTSLLASYCDQVLASNQKVVDDYRAGNQKVLGFLVGQCMKQSQGQGNPKIFQELLLSKL